MKQQTIAQLLKHDFKSKGSLSLYDTNGNLIYGEYSNGYWFKSDFDSNDNNIYFETSDGYWSKREYNANGREIYFKNSDGKIIDNRPKQSCEGKVVEIDGKQYKLTEI